MSVRTISILGLKVAGLSIYLFLVFAVASALTMPAETAQERPEDAGAAALALLAVCATTAMVLAYLVVRSRWTGWRLVATIFLAHYGVTIVMSQIESAVFITRLPPGFLPRLLLMGAIVSAAFAPAIVLALGRWKGPVTRDDPKPPVATSPFGWAWRFAAIAVIYVVLYFTFGYFVAWRNPAVREYYGGTDPGTFFAQMGNVLRDTPWLPAFQVLRSAMWALIALPVIRMMRGAWWEAGLATALLFAVVMNSQLLLPNPYMPEAVRMAHLAETASSNFLFGWVVAWLLRPFYMWLLRPFSAPARSAR